MRQKLLVLGGKPMGSCEIVNYAKKVGLYTIVTDYLNDDISPAKKIADETWSVSTDDLDKLESLCKLHNVSGIVSGVHEFNIRQSIKLSNRLDLPTFCTIDQWDAFADKNRFKDICKKYDLNVADLYFPKILNGEVVDDIGIEYPVITKPADSSGSRGFSICHNLLDLKKGYAHAVSFSDTSQVLVEKYLEHKSLVAYYSIIKGEPVLSVLADKYPKEFPNGASIAGLHVYPSFMNKKFLSSTDGAVKNMLKGESLNKGDIWFEVFFCEGRFYLNEAGYRLSGSLSNYPVEYYTGHNQIHNYLSLSAKNPIQKFSHVLDEKNLILNIRYCILPVQVKPGTITDVIGFDKVLEKDWSVAFPHTKAIGDKIEQWNSGQQTFGYFHFIFQNEKDLELKISNFKDDFSVLDENGKDIMFTLFDENKDLVFLNEM